MEVGLPAVVAKRRARDRWIEAALLVVMLIGGAGGAYYWWQRLHPALPAGIFFGNGRLEADEINIDTKYRRPHRRDPGRRRRYGQGRASRRAHGYARSRGFAEEDRKPQVDQAQRAVDEANANVAQQKTQVLLAQQECDRAAYTGAERASRPRNSWISGNSNWMARNAALQAAQYRVIEAEHALDAATHDVELYNVEIADNTLVAPRDGRIQYRIANVGEVLAGRRQGLRDARHLLRLHGHLSADRRGGKGQIRRRRPHRARRLSRMSRSRPRCRSSPPRRNSRPRRSRPRASATS